jgi:DNA-binding XRE family transcriptional regulator
MIENKLKEIRMKKYMMNKRDFAKMLNIAEQQYYRYEKGITTPTLELSLRISNLLEISVNDIWGLSDS